MELEKIMDDLELPNLEIEIKGDLVKPSKKRYPLARNEESAILEIATPPRKSFFTVAKLSLGLSLLSLTLIGAGTYFAWGPVAQYRNTNPEIDGYVQPRSISTLVDLVQASTVTIYCEAESVKNSGLGTGWAIDITTVREKEFPTALVTNYHVIENCISGGSKVFVEEFGGDRHPAIIANWDVENDLAIVATKLKLNPLKLSENIPYPGYWVMAVGTADGYAGSVAFGNVLNILENEILITAALSSGNSGGPLVDNEGYVVGINSLVSKKEQYNIAMSLDALCYVIKKCTNGTFWDWES